jgi:uncharacterized membrane protein
MTKIMKCLRKKIMIRICTVIVKLLLTLFLFAMKFLKTTAAIILTLSGFSLFAISLINDAMNVLYTFVFNNHSGFELIFCEVNVCI